MPPPSGRYPELRPGPGTPLSVATPPDEPRPCRLLLWSYRWVDTVELVSSPLSAALQSNVLGAGGNGGLDVYLVTPVDPLKGRKILLRFVRVVACAPAMHKASSNLPLARAEVQVGDAEAFMHGYQVIEDGLLEGGLAHVGEQTLDQPADLVTVTLLVGAHEFAVEVR